MMTANAFAVLALASAGAAQPLTAAFAEQNHAALWASFKTTYGRRYAAPAEAAAREQVFRANMQAAAAMQQQSATARFGATKFADLTPAEFKARYMTLKEALPEGTPAAAAAAPTAPFEDKDWRKFGAVTAVKDQANCGACWAFAAVGAIEGGAVVKANATLTDLSEQQLISCDMVDVGCDGGRPQTAYQWLVDNNHGELVTEAAYPYTSGAHHTVGECRYASNMEVGATITGWKALPTDEAAIAAYLTENGPVSVGVDADSWQWYTGGVMDMCFAGWLGHAVLAVGVTNEFWIIKNTWGTDWGEAGYIRLQYGQNPCGITKKATVPLF